MPEAQHSFKDYEQELERLRDLITEMGGLVESELALAIEAVVRRNEAAATAAVGQDPRVDTLKREVESLAVLLIALRPPTARDLRQIVGVLKMTVDLERIGDYAANVAKRSTVLSQFNLPFSLAAMGNMARLVQQNLKLAIDSLDETDAEKAEQVWRADEEIDDLYTAIFRELITYMMEDPRSITPCTHLLFIAKNLERIGDHATNVAEAVHHTATGEALADSRPKGDTSPFIVVRGG